MSKKRWDIFCKVVDNFGDIGVCWRLARQLHRAHGLQIRLFVDQLPVAAKILTGIGNAAEQDYEGVTIVRWDEQVAFESTADVVIETFACGLPPAYLAKLDSDVVWVNVDYLSAEAWVSEFHALHGQHPETNLTRHFFFPGFNESTGGLLREQDLITRRDAFQQSEDLQREFWQPLGVNKASDDLKISLFSYPNAPIEPLLQSLIDGERSVSVLMPMNSSLPTSLLGNEGLTVGDCLTEGALTLYILPFLSQDDYDKLLWACDVNFVRGEDSWVRALWAGRPFVWQPYLQTDNAHLVKVNAFLDAFYARDLSAKQAVVDFYQAWSIGEFETAYWARYIDNLPEISTVTLQQSNQLAKQGDLASQLVDFCEQLSN